MPLAVRVGLGPVAAGAHRAPGARVVLGRVEVHPAAVVGTARFHPNLNYLDFYGVKIGSADVPEPMSLMLVGGGLAGLRFTRRKKRA